MPGGLCSPQQNDKCPPAIYNWEEEQRKGNGQGGRLWSKKNGKGLMRSTGDAVPLQYHEKNSLCDPGQGTSTSAPLQRRRIKAAHLSWHEVIWIREGRTLEHCSADDESSTSATGRQTKSALQLHRMPLKGNIDQC